MSEEEGGKLRLDFEVDLARATEESLERVRNQIVERVAKDLRTESERLREELPTHDRHGSYHESGV